MNSSKILAVVRGAGRRAARRVGVVRAWEWVREVSERGGEGEGGIEET